MKYFIFLHFLNFSVTVISQNYTLRDRNYVPTPEHSFCNTTYLGIINIKY